MIVTVIRHDIKYHAQKKLLLGRHPQAQLAGEEEQRPGRERGQRLAGRHPGQRNHGRLQRLQCRPGEVERIGIADGCNQPARRVGDGDRAVVHALRGAAAGGLDQRDVARNHCEGPDGVRATARATGERPDGTAGLGAANPEMEAYYNALAQQDLGLASEAQKRGQENLAFGTTLYNTGAGLLGGYDTGVTGALSPFSAYLGGATNLESLGQQPLTIGASLGGGNTASANALLQGGMGAAATRGSVAGLNPTADFISGLGGNKDLTGYLSGLFGGGSKGTNATGYGWGGGTDFSVLPSSWG